MRYRRKRRADEQRYGTVYICNHPVYNRCTLYTYMGRGLAVIQQKCRHKRTWWEELDADLANDLYLNPGFMQYFLKRAKQPVKGIYPTVTVRQAMWALKMKPIPKERWETVFDRAEI